MRQLIDLQVPEQRPTPTVAPVIHWVVETGSSVELVSTISRDTGNGETGSHTQAGSENDSAGSTKLHGETTSRGVKGQAVTENLHDVVTVGPDTESDTSTTHAPILLLAACSFYTVSMTFEKGELTESRWGQVPCCPQGHPRARSGRW